jgi:hypothetical protein
LISFTKGGKNMKPQDVFATGINIISVVATATTLGVPPVAGLVAAGGLISFGFCKAWECFNNPQN